MASNLVVTPHPLTLDGQTHIPAQLLPGQSLYSFLAANAPDTLDGGWAVTIGGRQVPVEMWTKTFPKDGHLIEVRSTVDNKQAFQLIALLVLTYFTFGIGAAAGAWTVAGAYGAVAATAVYVAGSVIINKVLGPKPPKTPAAEESGGVYSLNGATNSSRPYQALGIPFGAIDIAPDLLSKPYSYFDGDDQYLALLLTPGINVARVDNVRNGDNPFSNYPGSQLFSSGMSGMPQQAIPLFTDVDSQAGGALQDEDKNPAVVVRTTPPDTVRIQVDIEYTLFGKGKKGNALYNEGTVTAEYRTAGSGSWLNLETRYVTNKDMRVHRMSLKKDVPPGQYDVRVTRSVMSLTGDNDVAQFNFTSLTSVQRDTAQYLGISRVGIIFKATGQLSGTPNEIKMRVTAKPVQTWTGTQWRIADTVDNGLSNPGAQMLAYIRGYYDEAGNLIGGMGLSDMFIDIPAFQAFILHCEANDYKYNYYLRDSRTHSEVLESIALVGFGQVTNATGKISVAWAGANQPVTAVVGMGTIRQGQFGVDYTLSNTADGVELSYFDADIGDTSVVRVASPGVTTALNPARIQAEGITTAKHAAEMARYHLGQSLYQAKDITFGADIEHITYRRLSVLSLSHDLTQWGYSGRLMAAAKVSGVVTLFLDTEVPPPSAGNAYVGVRIPGELSYRVMQVRPFSAPSKSIQLVGAWPIDAAFPGEASDNPAWDTTYCYDFKASPGYTVRVVGITPDADLKGAQVSVVPESAEFWNYVKTGTYIPAPNGSGLNTRPTVSGLKIVEAQVVQGNTVFTELSATWEVSGPYARADVLMAEGSGDSLLQTTSTTRSATWRIPGAGVYTVTVRPFNPDGLAGYAQSIVFATKGADAPPVNPDIFDVQQVSGGLRRYVWGFGSDTIQSADYAGVEIRYTSGSVQSPVWETMLPVAGDDGSGLHTAPFESPTPVSGTYTFSLRAVNTSGRLSDQTLTIVRALGKNLGELLDQINNDVSKAIVDAFQRDEAEARARVDAINAVITQVQDEATARATAVQQVTAALNQSIADQTAALLNEQLDRQAAIQTANQLRQSGDESLAYQISQISAGTGMQFDGIKTWYFDTSSEGWNGTAASGYLNPGDVYATSPTGLGVNGNAHRYVKMRIKRVGTPVWSGQLGWRSAGGTWSSLALSAPTFDANGVATVDANDIPWADTTVDQIRVKLSDTVTSSNYYLFDWVAIGRPTPGASVALVEDVRQANATALAAEAQQRNTLAVQLRGNYTGNDLDGLTSGLVYQERTARVTETSAISTRVDGMQVSLDGKASASALQTLSTKVETIDDRVTSASESVFALEAQLDGHTAGETGWTAGDTSVHVGARTVYSVIAESDIALARRVDTVSSDLGQFKGSATQQLQTLSTAQDSQAQLYQQVSASLDTKASTSSVNLLTTRVTEAEGNITANSQNIAQAQAAIANKADASAVSALQTTVTTIDGRTTANANSITAVQAAVDGKAAASTVLELTATVNSQGSTLTSINSQAFLALNSNNYIGGFKIGNNGQVVDFTVLADNFRIVAPAGGARLEYSAGTLRVYDNNNVLRVELGKLS
ncbi:central tail fiber J [Xanthomonas phage Xop411]|uniref:p22 n=1 Tax=Xanthomonas phage Xop411 TaxID=2913975 RepID=A5H1M5_9CAUD|nr:central tail fiber J [Xanthomonas phage Xop411]ABK00169.1 p22 [Xanthomonas phage Xop411]